MDCRRSFGMLIAVVLGASLLATCGSTPEEHGPRAGHWEGGPAVTFDVTDAGQMRNFELTASWGITLCTVQLDEVPIAADGTFLFSYMIPEEEYGYAGRVTPIASSQGPMVEAQRITGKFISASTVTGTFKILVCGDNHFYWEKDFEVRTWSAAWEGSQGVASTPIAGTPAVLLIVTPTAVTLPPIPTQAPQPTSTVPPAGTICVGGYVRVLPAVGLALRQSPHPDGALIRFLDFGTVLQVIGGPQEAAGYTWWQLRKVDDGQEGWAAAGAGADVFLEPVLAP